MEDFETVAQTINRENGNCRLELDLDRWAACQMAR